jgi:hypothetical protein
MTSALGGDRYLATRPLSAHIGLEGMVRASKAGSMATIRLMDMTGVAQQVNRMPKNGTEARAFTDHPWTNPDTSWPKKRQINYLSVCESEYLLARCEAKKSSGHEARSAV